MTSTPFGWAIVGPGAIAATFARALRGVEGARLQAIWGRDARKAQEFARHLGLDARCVSAQLEGLLGDPRVHAVYIATTHDAHAEFAARALAAGKPVLCEKPMSLCEADTRRLCALSREHGVFLMEGLWTRMLPLYRELAKRLGAGAIGELRSVHSSFCFAMPYAAGSRLFDPARGGGALLDIGVYNVAMSRWAVQCAQRAPARVVSRALHSRLAPSGVDLADVGTLRFDGGVLAQFTCAFDRAGANALELQGSEGCIRVPRDFWSAQQAEHMHADGRCESLQLEHAVNGFEYQIAEAMRCIRGGLRESPCMPHEESVALARELDALRALAQVAGAA